MARCTFADGDAIVFIKSVLHDCQDFLIALAAASRATAIPHINRVRRKARHYRSVVDTHTQELHVLIHWIFPHLGESSIARGRCNADCRLLEVSRIFAWQRTLFPIAYRRRLHLWNLAGSACLRCGLPRCAACSNPLDNLVASPDSRWIAWLAP